MARSNLLSGLLYGKRSWILSKSLVDKLINTVTLASMRIYFCIRGLDNPLTLNQCLSYFDSFKQSVGFK